MAGSLDDYSTEDIQAHLAKRQQSTAAGPQASSSKLTEEERNQTLTDMGVSPGRARQIVTGQIDGRAPLVDGSNNIPVGGATNSSITQIYSGSMADQIRFRQISKPFSSPIPDAQANPTNSLPMRGGFPALRSGPIGTVTGIDQPDQQGFKNVAGGLMYDRRFDPRDTTQNLVGGGRQITIDPRYRTPGASAFGIGGRTTTNRPSAFSPY